MDKAKLNWTEVQFSENLEAMFEVLIDSWLQDAKDGNYMLIPETIEQAKETINKASREWTVVLPHGDNTDWNIYYIPLRIAFVLIRDEIVRELLNDLFINKNEVIELATVMQWINQQPNCKSCDTIQQEKERSNNG